MASRTTRTELEREKERVFCRWIYFHLRSKIFLWPSSGAIVPIAPAWIQSTTGSSRPIGVRVMMSSGNAAPRRARRTWPVRSKSVGLFQLSCTVFIYMQPTGIEQNCYERRGGGTVGLVNASAYIWPLSVFKR